MELLLVLLLFISTDRLFHFYDIKRPLLLCCAVFVEILTDYLLVCGFY
jgi:hypothetical protein